MGNGQEAKFGNDVAQELAGLPADPRLERRGQTMLEVWQHSPGLGFPEIFDTSAELEAAYRFFGNPNLDFATVLAPHVAKSIERCQRFGEVLCIQDTSTFVFSGEREGLGYINSANRGFLGHFAMLVSRTMDGAPIPLGLVEAKTWVRDEPRKTKAVPQHKLRQSDDCESHRWLQTVQQSEAKLQGISSPIHVMDREGDIYDCTSTMVEKGFRFVVRCMSNRVIESDDPNFHLLYDALDGLEVRYRDTVTVSPRKGSKLPDQRKTYPARKGRLAEVCVTATTVTVKRTRNSSEHYPATTEMNLVHVFEPCSPSNDEAVQWILLTNEPIGTDEQIRAIVGCYRQRWVIEEFFKAVKTGCAFSKRQLQTYQALTTALAMTLPIAWNLLLLRTQSRSNQNVPGKHFIDEFRLEVLRAHAVRFKLPENPSLRDVAYAIAGMGGYLKRKDPPGWLTLRRGFEKLLILEEGWIMSRATCDQP